MYDTTWWAWLVTVWEVVVYNSVLDLQQCWQVQPSPLHPPVDSRLCCPFGEGLADIRAWELEGKCVSESPTAQC